MGEAKKRKASLGKGYGVQALTPREVVACVHSETYKDSYIDATITDTKEQKTRTVKFHIFYKAGKLYAECPFMVMDEKELLLKPPDEKTKKYFNIISPEDASFAALIGKNINYLSPIVCEAVKVLMKKAKIVLIGM